MSRTITPPTARIPIGLAMVNGREVEVRQHPEFVRFFFDLFARVGRADALSNTELAQISQALIDATPQPISSIDAQEALRAVDELRNELASIRGENDRLRREVDDIRGQLESAPSFQPLASRVQQIEERLQ